MSVCRTCKAPIRWALSQANQRPMPLDYEPDPGGNVSIVYVGGEQFAIVLGPADRAAAEIDGRPLYMPHYATCPQAAEHRKRVAPA